MNHAACRRHAARRRPARALSAAITALAAAVLAAAVPASLPGQTLQGRIIDDADRPIAGAFVILFDETGEERARALTTGKGAYLLRASEPGVFRLTVERIGFEDRTTDPIPLADGQSVSHQVRIQPRPVRLDRIEVAATSRCAVLSDEGEALEVVRVWDEARKALEATAWTDRQSYYRFDILLVRRTLDRNGEPRTEPVYEPIRVYGRHPFRSTEADDLAFGGWVQPDGARGLKFFAPDAEVLLSNSFESRHCFYLVRPESRRNGLIGIGFEPLPERTIADISGVLWLDAATAELRSLDFRYERLRLPVSSEHLGGHVEFDALPDGGWIVRRWEIRTPLAEVHEAKSFSGRRSQRLRLSGLRAEGQLVTAVWRT
ncbi:MAG: carboxypeptidase-like regulatory domain-containing protein, partial [Gemmatimonadota bacterium]